MYHFTKESERWEAKVQYLFLQALLKLMLNLMSQLLEKVMTLESSLLNSVDHREYLMIQIQEHMIKCFLSNSFKPNLEGHIQAQENHHKLDIQRLLKLDRLFLLQELDLHLSKSTKATLRNKQVQEAELEEKT